MSERPEFCETIWCPNFANQNCRLDRRIVKEYSNRMKRSAERKRLTDLAKEGEEAELEIYKLCVSSY